MGKMVIYSYTKRLGTNTIFHKANVVTRKCHKTLFKIVFKVNKITLKNVKYL